MSYHTTDFSARLAARPKKEGAVTSIAHISLNTQGHIKYAPEIAYEREQALADLLEESHLVLKDLEPGPYHLQLQLEEDRFIMLVNKEKISLSLTPLKTTIHDYFLLCENFYKEARNGQGCKLETLDMGRRGIHNEGADWLLKRLASRLVMDQPTARRLFTLICILHIRCATTLKKTIRGNNDDV